LPYQLDFVSSARREFLALPPGIQRRIDAHLLKLPVDPRPRGTKSLKGHAGLYRIRVGEYRVVYEIDDAARVVTVTRVRLRARAYRNL
jgi:mRNA interferase RelE/StbE